MDKNINWRYGRQDYFDITKKKLNPFTFGDKKWLVYDNVNLSIFIGDYCNADCDFCVAKLRYINDGSTYIKPRINNDAEYLNRLEDILRLVAPLNPSISLTGGEPTHYERIIPIIELLNKYNIRKRTITTNGTGLFFLYKGKTILDHLIDNGFLHLNISKAHYDDEKNMSIMRYDKISFDNEFLARIQERIHKTTKKAPRVRLSCVLLDEGIGTVQEMKNYMEVALKYGVDNVVFRELMNYNKETINKEHIVYKFSERNRILLNNIWEQVEKDKDFTFSNQVLGYYYYVEVYNYKGIAMVSESANLKQIYTEKTNVLSKTNGIPVVYEMVFHPNGTLNGSWREWEDILIK